MNLYFFSGLGADHRAFKYIYIDKAYQTKFIEWVIPNENSTIEDYAQQLLKQIDTKSEFAFVAVSFGGLMAIELMKLCKPKFLILISSFIAHHEIPFYYKLAGRLNLSSIIPSGSVNKPNFISYWMFGIKSEKDKLLLSEILTSTNTKFSRWAVNQLLKWKNEEIFTNTIRIHGDQDKLIPIRKNQAYDYIILNGGHFMIANRADEISSILNSILKINE